jgi:hypothetical protein
MRTELPAERLHRRLAAEPGADSHGEAVAESDDGPDDDQNSLLPRWLPDASESRGWVARMRADPGRAGAIGLAVVAALAVLVTVFTLMRDRPAPVMSAKLPPVERASTASPRSSASPGAGQPAGPDRPVVISVVRVGVVVRPALGRPGKEPPPMAERIDWPPVLYRGRQIVESYDTPITLRQLFYRLVSELWIPNTRKYYQRLSEYTAKGRRDGTFPDLTDRTRRITEYRTFDSPRQALSYTSRIYRRDRTEGQDVSIYMGVEKDGMASQLETWFTEPLGLPVVALGGYASQSFVDQVVEHVTDQDRDAVLIYAGDHDPTGWDIDRDFIERTDCFAEVRRVALDPALVVQYQLPSAVDNDELTAAKLDRDPRAKGFVRRFGALTQVELDALPVDVLRQLYQDAVDEFWDRDLYRTAVEQETAEREQLQRLARDWRAAQS